MCLVLNHHNCPSMDTGPSRGSDCSTAQIYHTHQDQSMRVCNRRNFREGNILQGCQERSFCTF